MSLFGNFSNQNIKKKNIFLHLVSPDGSAGIQTLDLAIFS
jgi:hypothetical protein